MKLCLIINDSSVIRKVGRSLLNSIGYEVVEAETGEQALAACEEKLPDAILLDWDLQDMSGYDFLMEFRRRYKDHRSHIIYATTENDPVSISHAIKAGAEDCMFVPFNRADIQEKFPVAA